MEGQKKVPFILNSNLAGVISQLVRKSRKMEAPLKIIHDNA